MMQLTPQMRILVSVDPVDFRAGIDGLCRICRAQLGADPFSGAVFVFRSRRGTAIRLLCYDGQGFWLCHKRLSMGRFRYWPRGTDSGVHALLAHELQVLVMGGDPSATQAAPAWRALDPTGVAARLEAEIKG
jgi:transposase